NILESKELEADPLLVTYIRKVKVGVPVDKVIAQLEKACEKPQSGVTKEHVAKFRQVAVSGSSTVQSIQPVITSSPLQLEIKSEPEKKEEEKKEEEKKEEEKKDPLPQVVIEIEVRNVTELSFFLFSKNDPAPSENAKSTEESANNAVAVAKDKGDSQTVVMIGEIEKTLSLELDKNTQNTQSTENAADFAE
ncbi:hypothetical protein RFI_00417, partial [Reticulomyxa filosa]